MTYWLLTTHYTGRPTSCRSGGADVPGRLATVGSPNELKQTVATPTTTLARRLPHTQARNLPRNLETGSAQCALPGRRRACR